MTAIVAVDDCGISRPADYHEAFSRQGTWAVATKPDGPVGEMHNDCTRPGDVSVYRGDGKFPDGPYR